MKNKGEIAYKVISNKSRYGSNIAMFEYNCNMSLEESMKKYPYLKKYKYYFKKYDVGKLVKAKPKSAGILCFRTWNDALHFCNHFSVNNSDIFQIIKVKGFHQRIGKITLISGCANIRKLTNEFYNNFRSEKHYFNPKGFYDGVIAFDSVRVLE